MSETGVFIKFDPEKIAETAMSLEQQHKRFVQSISNIKKKSEILTKSWLGDSSTLYMEKVNELNALGETMEKVLLKFSQDLASVSGIYKTGETNAKKEAESLPTEGIFLV